MCAKIVLFKSQCHSEGHSSLSYQSMNFNEQTIESFNAVFYRF